MAKKGGGFGRVLEFIGLVDDEDPRDIYEDEYQSGNYGRQQAYTPQRQQPQRQQPQRQPAALTTRRATPAYEPTRAPRMSRTGTSASRFDQPPRSPAGTPRRANAQPERPQRYDYSPRTSRFGSLEDSPADTQRGAASRSAGSSRQRTVMFTLHHLEDCCDVIDNLILNNTVVLTIDNIDPRLMQRAVDTLSGAVFALHATIRKASEHTYLIAPSGVEVNETYDMGKY